MLLENNQVTNEVSTVSNTTVAFGKPLMYKTCKVLITTHNGLSATARALINMGSGASFIEAYPNNANWQDE